MPPVLPILKQPGLIPPTYKKIRERCKVLYNTHDTWEHFRKTDASVLTQTTEGSNLTLKRETNVGCKDRAAVGLCPSEKGDLKISMAGQEEEREVRTYSSRPNDGHAFFICRLDQFAGQGLGNALRDDGNGADLHQDEESH